VKKWEVFMRPTIHSTQVVTPFGSGYVHEDHNNGSVGQQPRHQWQTVLAIVLTVALFGMATAAAISTSSNCSPGTVDGGNMPSILGKLPGSIGFEEALY
jgi:hypothetical protein